MAADDGDTVDARGNDREDRIAIFKKDNAVFFDVLGDCKALFDIEDAFLRRIVHDARQKLGIENAARVVVNFRERHAPGIDGIQQLGAEVIGHGLLLIEPGG